MYVATAVTYLAHDHCNIGWRCNNGNLLRTVNDLIQQRSVPLYINWRRSSDRNGHIKEAHNIAKKALSLPCTSLAPTAECQYLDPEENRPPHTALILPKVSTNAPAISEATNDSESSAIQPTSSPAVALLPSHRGWDKWRMMRLNNLRKIIDAPNPKAFWRQIRYLADARPAPLLVTAFDLQPVFERRLNPPEILPETFDPVQHRLNTILASMIPDETEDTTPELLFSRPWTADDAAEVKSHLQQQSLSNATGDDNLLYTEIMPIPNEDIAHLANE